MTPDLLDALNHCRAKGEAVCLLSTSTSGAQRLIRLSDLPGEESAIAEAAHKAFRTDKQQTVQAGDEARYITPFNPAIHVIIVGAVHITQALYPMLNALGFRATIIDPRGAFARTDRFEGADVIVDWPDDALGQMTVGHRTAIVTLTHDPKLDDPALSLALKNHPFYIGALGSKRTHAKRVERLKAQVFTDDDIANISAPIGLDIGASGAAEIAISIAADIVQALRKDTL